MSFDNNRSPRRMDSSRTNERSSSQQQRQKLFNQNKDDKMKAALDKKASDEMKECTFEPAIYESQRNGGNDTTRDLDHFLEDQQRFLEKKNEKANQRKLDDMSREVEELSLQPKLDDLSVQIVQMMDERKGQQTYDRLYKKGYESLREKALRELEQKQAAEEQSSFRSSPSRMNSVSYDPNRTYHRGKDAQTALYELHTDILKNKQEAIN